MAYSILGRAKERTESITASIYKISLAFARYIQFWGSRSDFQNIKYPHFEKIELPYKSREVALTQLVNYF